MFSTAGAFGGPLVFADAAGANPAGGLVFVGLWAVGWLLVGLMALAALVLLSCREPHPARRRRRSAPDAEPRWDSGPTPGRARYRPAHP